MIISTLKESKTRLCCLSRSSGIVEVVDILEGNRLEELGRWDGMGLGLTSWRRREKEDYQRL